MSNETPLSPEAEKLAAARKRNLDLALSQIQKDFGENAIMRLGDNVKMEVDVIPTGNLLIDRSGCGRLCPRPHCGNLRTGILR